MIKFQHNSIRLSYDGSKMETREELDKRLVAVTPSERQIKFQETEFYAFVHFYGEYLY